MRAGTFCSKVNAEKCHKKHWKVFDKFWILIPCSATSILDVCAPVLLNTATKDFLDVKITMES